MSAASPARKVHLPGGKLFSSALCVADRIESDDSSIPATFSKVGDSVMEKKSTAIVCIDQMCRFEESHMRLGIRGEDGVPNVGGDWYKDRVVILEEGTSEVLKMLTPTRSLTGSW